MAWRSGGSVSRSFISSARAPSLRSSSSLPRVRPPQLAASRSPSRRLPFAATRNFAELGCAQSFLPLHSMVATTQLTSHLTANLRAWCELSHGTFCRTCQDR